MVGKTTKVAKKAAKPRRQAAKSSKGTKPILKLPGERT
jgi:hypothetical protein